MRGADRKSYNRDLVYVGWRDGGHFHPMGGEFRNAGLSAQTTDSDTKRELLRAYRHM